jgi:hypothetical protein
MKNKSFERKKTSRLFVAASLAIVGLSVIAAVKLWPRSDTPVASTAPADSPAAREVSPVGARRDYPSLPEAASAPSTPGQPSRPEGAPKIVPSSPGPRETICTKDGCFGPQQSEEKTRRLLEENPGRFGELETAILKAYTVDGLTRAVRDAESRFLKATAETRDRDGEYYRHVLNLAASLAPAPAPMPDHQKLAYERYAVALRQAQPELAKMSPEAADRERMRIKENIFAGPQARR